MAETLLHFGAAVNARDADGWTPLHVACDADNPELVQLLLAVSPLPAVSADTANCPLSEGALSKLHGGYAC